MVVLDGSGKTVRTLKQALGHATNNVAEYCALVFGLSQALSLGAHRVTVLTDSELVARQVNGEYKIKDANLKPLFLIAEHLGSLFQAFEIRHIPREENSAADQLAKAATGQFL